MPRRLVIVVINVPGCFGRRGKGKEKLLPLLTTFHKGKALQYAFQHCKKAPCFKHFSHLSLPSVFLHDSSQEYCHWTKSCEGHFSRCPAFTVKSFFPGAAALLKEEVKFFELRTQDCAGAQVLLCKCSCTRETSGCWIWLVLTASWFGDCCSFYAFCSPPICLHVCNRI